MFRHRLHRAMRPCTRCNRANDDEPSHLIGQIFTRDPGLKRMRSAAGGNCSGSSLGLVPGKALVLYCSTDLSALDIPPPASLSILRPSIPRSCIPFSAGYPPPAPNGIRRRSNRSSWLPYLLRAAQRLARSLPCPDGSLPANVLAPTRSPHARPPAQTFPRHPFAVSHRLRLFP